jgi:hypothetical protein
MRQLREQTHLQTDFWRRFRFLCDNFNGAELCWCAPQSSSEMMLFENTRGHRGWEERPCECVIGRHVVTMYALTNRTDLLSYEIASGDENSQQSYYNDDDDYYCKICWKDDCCGSCWYD